jgi:RNA polymerase sigma-70 factor (ECF subfamily)
MPEALKYTEPELVDLLTQHQQSAFSYLYDNYSAALYGIILSIVPDRDLANDVLQEVFVKIWKQVTTYDATKGKLFTWMMNIARNASIDMLRSKHYQRSKQNRELTEAVYEKGGSTSTNVEQIGLRKLVYSLREEYRVLIELSYFEGFTQDEISRKLNLPLGTVKTRLRSALIQLRELMKK